MPIPDAHWGRSPAFDKAEAQREDEIRRLTEESRSRLANMVNDSHAESEAREQAHADEEKRRIAASEVVETYDIDGVKIELAKLHNDLFFLKDGKIEMHTDERDEEEDLDRIRRQYDRTRTSEESFIGDLCYVNSSEEEDELVVSLHHDATSDLTEKMLEKFQSRKVRITIEDLGPDTKRFPRESDGGE